MKWKEKMQEFKDLNLEGLKAKEADLSEELFWLKIKHKSGQLSNFTSITKVKKDLARIKTFLNAREREQKKA